MSLEMAGVCQSSSAALGTVASQSPLVRHATPGAAPGRYSVYGLTVSSEIALSVPATSVTNGTVIDLMICRRKGGPPFVSPTWRLVTEIRCQCPVHQGNVVTQLFREDDVAWIWSASAGWFRVAAGACQIDVYADGSVDERDLSLVLLGQILVYALQRRGQPCLHASAVRVNGDAVVFLGANGRGKSTMAACFLAHGAELLTDDVLPLRLAAKRVDAMPGLPILKLWRESVEHTLHLSGDLPTVTPTNDKSLLALGEQYGYAPGPASVRAVYVLGRVDANEHSSQSSTDVVVTPLSGQESMAILLASMALRQYLAPTEGGRFLPALVRLIGQAPVRLITFPSGFEYQELVYQRILADLTGREAE